MPIRGTFCAMMTVTGVVSVLSAQTPALTPFVDPLPIPSVYAPDPGTTDEYTISVLETTQKLHRDLPETVVWGYNGLFPGPSFDVRAGEPIRVNWLNDLRDVTTGELRTTHYLPVDTCMHGPDHHGTTARTVVHVHGGHNEAAFDGYPEFTIVPGQSQMHEYTNNQKSATIWYHDHALGITRLNVYMGLAGFYLIRDDVEDALDLPSGEFEIPLVIQDRTFNADGSLDYPEEWTQLYFGDVILANGKVWPFLEVAQGKYRFRVLNGSGSRTYRLHLPDDAPFVQIGTDMGLREAPQPLSELILSPGERADVVIDFENYAPGTELILTNDAPSPWPNGAVGVPIPNVMKFIVTDQPGHTAPLPSFLRPFVPIPESEAIQVRDLVSRRSPQNSPECAPPWWTINDLGWDDIVEFPRLGTTEIWRFANPSGMMHPMHMHMVEFQVLDRDGFSLNGLEIIPNGNPVPPSPDEQGWKDTVRVNPGEVVRVIARFEDYLGKFAYHCHILEHEDHEMMRQFQVVPCWPCEFGGDPTVVDIEDLLPFVDAWLANDPSSDYNGDGVTDDIIDLLDYLDCWFPASGGATCP